MAFGYIFLVGNYCSMQADYWPSILDRIHKKQQLLFLGFYLHLYTYICIKIVNGLSLPRKLSCVHCCYCILFDFIYSPIHQSTKAHLKLFFNVNYPVPPLPPGLGLMTIWFSPLQFVCVYTSSLQITSDFTRPCHVSRLNYIFYISYHVVSRQDKHTYNIQ